ncbi:helix-turn-helix domain-containing protein, partial [Aliarcobacter butzleri]
MTILEIIQNRRLEVAKELLKDDVSIKEAATKAGYKHTGHFRELQYSPYNISPNTYNK